jgi:hypothetical protein
MIAETRPASRPLILLAEAEAFRADYLRLALHDAGMHPLGPVRAVAEGLALLANLRDRPAAAVVNLRLGDGSAHPLVDEVARLGIPLLLTGDAGMSLPKHLMERPYLLAPYASYQIVEAVQHLTSRPESPVTVTSASESEHHG